VSKLLLTRLEYSIRTLITQVFFDFFRSYCQKSTS